MQGMENQLAPNPSLGKRNLIRTLDSTGDTIHSWDPENDVEVNTARLVFASLIEKGYLAFEVTTKGHPVGQAVEEFDRDLEKLYFEEPLVEVKPTTELNPKAETTVVVPPVKGGPADKVENLINRVKDRLLS